RDERRRRRRLSEPHPRHAGDEQGADHPVPNDCTAVRVPGRTAAVTGGASGLGRATACALHAAGASVALIDLPGAPGEEAAAALGDRAGFFPADVTSGDGLAAALAAAEGALGPIHIAVSSAGVATIAPGLFDTPMLGLLPEEARQQLAAGIPHPRRLGRPEEFAALVRHIVENPMINGEVIRLDGALRMPAK